MEHEELQGLMGAAALAALDDDEAVAVRRHLADCAPCARRAAVMVALAAALPAVVDSREPPPDLRVRILAAAAEDRAVARVTASGGPGQKPFTGDADGRAMDTGRRLSWMAGFLRRLWARPVASATAVAAVLAVVAIGAVSFWAVQLQGRLGKTEDTLASSYEALAIMAQADQKWNFSGTAEAPSARGVLAYSSRRQSSSLVVWGLPISPDKTYTAWTVRGGTPAIIGDMSIVDRGMWIVIPGDVRSIEGVGVAVRDARTPPGSAGTAVLLGSIPSSG